MKVIFLDVDGVLNSCDFFNRDEDPSKRVIPHTPKNAIDPIAVKLFDTLVQESNAEIVLSSSWRICHTMDEMNEILADLGLSKKLLDVTPRIWWKPEEHSGAPRSQNERGNEIDTWLKKHPEVTHFVILDDDADMNPHMDKLVKTSWQHGLQPEHIEKAKIILDV